MKKVSLSLLYMIFCLTNYAQEADEVGAVIVERDIWTRIGDLIFIAIPLGNGVEMPFVIIWLLVGAIIFTLYMGFINITGFKHALDVVRGKFDDPNDPGEVSHFQALTAALSGTVGLGNIAGVAIAVSLGGGRCYFLDDPCRVFGNVLQVCRMYFRSKVSKYPCRWLGVRRTNVLFE